MSKERLEEINNFSSLPLKKRISLTKESIKKELKANDYHMPKNININTQYLLEIINQAERVQELEGDVRMHERVSYRNIERNIKLEQQNKRYREALEEANKELINLYNNLLDHKVTADEAIYNIELIGMNIIQDALKGE